MMNALTPNSARTIVPDPEDTRALRDALGKFATGVTIVTCASDDGPICITANSFSSISLDPPLVMWAVGKSSRRFRYFEDADRYAIHVLAREQSGVCDLASRDANALADIPHGLNMAGVPLIDGCLARFDCQRRSMHEAGDHVIIVGEVLRAEMRDGAPLTFFGGDFGTIAT